MLILCWPRHGGQTTDLHQLHPNHRQNQKATRAALARDSASDFRKRFPVIASNENLPVAPDRIAPDVDAWKLFVFRKSRDLLLTVKLLQELRAEIGLVNGGAVSTIDALVRAGEIETGLDD